MNFPENNSLEALRQHIEASGVDLSSWGTGKSKSLEGLQKEIENGKSQLILNENGQILRKVSVAKAEIFYKSPEGKTLRLTEEKRLFSDGRERVRDIAHSLSKKMRKNQTPQSALKGAFAKKLGITEPLNFEEINVVEDTNLSPSYPGLRSVYIFYNFRIVLNAEQYKAEGYIGRQTDKVTYYTWKEI